MSLENAGYSRVPPGSGQQAAVPFTTAMKKRAWDSQVRLNEDCLRVFDGDGSGPAILAVAPTGHIEGVTEVRVIPANSATDLIFGDALDPNDTWDAFDDEKPFVVTLMHVDGLVVAHGRSLTTVESSAPTVSSRTIAAGNPNALVIVLSEAVYIPDYSLLELTFTNGTQRNITATESGQGTTTLTFTLSGNASSGNAATLVIPAGSIHDLNGNAIAQSSASVTFSGF